MLALDLILRWMHIFGAIMLVGSTIFMRCTYLPAKIDTNFEPKAEFTEQLRIYWARMIMICTGQLLTSGVFGFIVLMNRYDIDKEAFPGSAYQIFFGIKFLIAMVIFFLAATLTGRVDWPRSCESVKSFG